MKTIDELQAEWVAYYRAMKLTLAQQIACTEDEVAFGPSSPEANHTEAAVQLLAKLQAHEVVQ
jgi:hypothetical protein